MENDIEEARERLEKRIKDIWFSTTYSQEQEEKDLKILLSDYKRVLKENEELKILEDDIQDKRIVYIDTPEFEENYILKQKIKDKLEELNKEIKSCTEIDAIFKIKQQQILQELLESEE